MAAPIAQLEDDWTNYSEVSTTGIKPLFCGPNFNPQKSFTIAEDSSTSEESNYGSMEDLVNKFEEKISSCFKSSFKTKDYTPTKSSSNSIDDMYDCDAIWKQLTDSYGLVQPLDWENSSVKKCFIPALHLTPASKLSQEKENLNESDTYGKKLEHEMNMHSVIEYNIYTEKSSRDHNYLETKNVNHAHNCIQTADEVIQELEEIMFDADEQDAAFDTELQDYTGIIISPKNQESKPDNEFDFDGSQFKRLSVSSQEESDRAKCLKKMSLNELNDELTRIEALIKNLSQQLLTELDFRDELKYINETRNTLISKVMEVQYKQDQFYKNNDNHNNRKKFGKMTKSFSTSTNNPPGRFLTTVIPVENPVAPNVEIMQVLIKILDAIKADSDEVPALLTTYILKVLVPAPSLPNALNL